jgi:hypothetical protein
VDAQPPGGLGHSEEQRRLLRAARLRHGLLARLMSSPSRTHPTRSQTTSQSVRPSLYLPARSVS